MRDTDMPRKDRQSFETEEAVRKNPGVDETLFREAQDLINELRRGGVLRPGYDLVLPFERPRSARSQRRYDRQHGGALHHEETS
jgi:hypothetical protein